jgi:hypothetical protein
VKAVGLDNRDRRALGHVADLLAVDRALEIRGSPELEPYAFVVDEPLRLTGLESALVEKLARSRA